MLLLIFLNIRFYSSILDFPVVLSLWDKCLLLLLLVPQEPQVYLTLVLWPIVGRKLFVLLWLLWHPRLFAALGTPTVQRLWELSLGVGHRVTELLPVHLELLFEQPTLVAWLPVQVADRIEHSMVIKWLLNCWLRDSAISVTLVLLQRSQEETFAWLIVWCL